MKLLFKNNHDTDRGNLSPFPSRVHVLGPPAAPAEGGQGPSRPPPGQQGDGRRWRRPGPGEDACPAWLWLPISEQAGLRGRGGGRPGKLRPHPET